MKCLEVTFQRRALWCPCCLLGVHNYPPLVGSWHLQGRQGAREEGEAKREFVKEDVSKLGSGTPIAHRFILKSEEASTGVKDHSRTI